MAGNYNQSNGYGAAYLAGMPFSAGRTFIVAASGDAGYNYIDGLFDTDPNGTPRRFSTIMAAIAACEANERAQILVAPGHTETITAAGGITLSKAGVYIRGLGDTSLRPTIAFSTAATASLLVSAANCTIDNFNIDLTGIDGLDNPINVQAAGFRLLNSRIIMAGASAQADIAILTDATCDYMVIDNNEFIGSSDAGVACAIDIVGGSNARITNNRIYGAFTAAVGGIRLKTTAPTNILIKGNFIANITASSTACITGVANTTGEISNNYLRITTDAGVAWIGTPGNTSLFQNYGVNNNGETGILVGTPSV